jgi:hypothetical protein
MEPESQTPPGPGIHVLTGSSFQFPSRVFPRSAFPGRRLAALGGALLLLPLPWPAGPAQAGPLVHPPGVENRRTLFVFASADSFQARYGRFFRDQFRGEDPAQLPTWLEVETDSLRFGESVVTRRVRVRDNEEEILAGLLELVSRRYEIGLTQFASEPAFPNEDFVLGHDEGGLTLVPYQAVGIQDSLRGPAAVRFLAGRGAFLTDREDDGTRVVLTRGNLKEVNIWYPTLAREVLHTHTIPGNIDPTGYLEFFEGSDRDMVMVSREFQLPIVKWLNRRK